MFDMSDLSHWLSVLGELWIGAQETFFFFHGKKRYLKSR